MTQRVASSVQILGAVVASFGVGMLSVAAGLICAGVCAVVFGVAAERGED